MFFFNWSRDRALGASIPRFSRYIGERLHNANAKFELGHRAQSRSFPTLRSNLFEFHPILAATAALGPADDNIEARRDAVPVVARFRMAARRDWVAATDGASNLAGLTALS